MPFLVFKNGKKVRTLFSSTEFEISRINGYTFSDDEKQLLLKTETEKILSNAREVIHTEKLAAITELKNH